jgi:DNA-binding response OmpR family regulator
MKNIKIAIIDEDRKILGELEEVLTMSGYAPLVVNDTYLAVDTIVQMKPDVILLGLKMPRKNGFELAGEINRVFETKRIPIVAMSDVFKDEFRFLLNLCGIDRFLKKPFQPLDVIWAIENVAKESNPSDAAFEISLEFSKAR